MLPRLDAQQAEGLITMAKIREKLNRIHVEREDLEARLTLLANAERRLRELEEQPTFLEDLPCLVGRMLVIREYETAEAARGPRFRKLYAMLGLRAAVHANGTLEMTVGATNTKGVMPCDGSGSPSTTSTPT